MRKLSIGDKFIPYCFERFYSLTLQPNSRPIYNEKNTFNNRINIDKQ